MTRAARGLRWAVGIGLGVAFFGNAAVAGAQPMSPSPSPSPTPSEQQQPGFNPPDLPNPNNRPANPNNPNNVDLADLDCWVVHGVPTMWNPGLSTAPGEQAWPCYYVYGLQPHP